MRYIVLNQQNYRNGLCFDIGSICPNFTCDSVCGSKCISNCTGNCTNVCDNKCDSVNI
ncbi:MAG: hypothetical protein KIB53_08240 [Paraclostridium bifermentans]|uniref:hypothetical protein n=1 Tax=Paraclostridium TaxID=1849822 RepID=UPI0013792BB8|nr:MULTISPECIES: hypothetical protein [Paraclostridium]MBS5953800.1 hypothetical protein [Paraclostridium bifermentans]